MREEGPGSVVSLSPSTRPKCPPQRERRAPAASPWGPGTGLAAQGRAAFQLAGRDLAVPSRRSLSGGQQRPFGECGMTYLTRLPVLRLLLGPLLFTSEVPRDLRDCILCPQLGRWSFSLS